MKKIFYVFLLSMSCLCCWACGSKSDTTTNEPTETILTPVPTIITETSEEFNLEEWGVQDKLLSEVDGNRARAYIRFPEHAGAAKGTGKVSAQVLSLEEKTLIILDTQSSENGPEVLDGKVENILPAFFVETEEIITDWRTVAYSDFEFHISSKELVTINDYEMCKYNGTHTFIKWEDEQKADVEYCLNFVAYATKLKTNGAYVYWMVLDESKEQTLGEYIEETALKMAKTLWDE